MFRGKNWSWPACKGLSQITIVWNIYLFCFNLTLFLFRELHREQMSIEHSMQDLDSAVGKLDNILMALYVIIAIVIIAVALVTHSFLMFCLARSSSFFILQEAQLITIVTSAGALILGSFQAFVVLLTLSLWHF